MQKGGSFLIESVKPEDIFTPEDFSDEHRMIAGMVADFAANELAPRIEELEEQKPGLARELMLKAGELGLLSADIPEEFGGGELGKVASAIIAENITAGGSFTVSHGAHTGIGTLPIVYFGNEEQKKKYLPGLASGELVAAYALTEPGAGSDALNAKTRAVLSPDGKHYILNGEKIFITNAGFADVFVTYAKVDGDKFTAFIVDKDTPGFSTGAEEKKMGIKGSSTRSLIFEDAKVPVENVLYEIGKGHVVAFNILNIGRFKLGASTAGSSKIALNTAVKYALERQQFKTPIARFGLIQKKVAEMAARTYASESAVYRTAGLIEEGLAGISGGHEAARRIEEYAVECSINKVHSSEVLDFVVDECVQIHGGYGYISEYPAERMYRDSRINRIFEGTNEINRLLIPGTILRKAMKGQLALLPAAQALAQELLSLRPGAPAADAPLAAEQAMVEMARKIFLMVGGNAAQKYMDKIQGQQEILGILADLVIEIYAMESALLRTQKALEKDGGAAEMKVLLTKAYIHDTFPRLDLLAREALAAMFEGDMLKTQLSALKKLTRYNPVDTIGLKRKIAARLFDAGRYAL
ncbi:MAG: acyl-CoA dehydrogenase family protein [Peptococcaceae bacterium]|nr:acyl-CoA dehydrogenase family protein [Peptococcaceae bacterium]